MKKVSLTKMGISMVALVITIIVLVILTSAVVLTGMGATKQAQLATFYNNVATVQDLVSLTMGNNMIEGALQRKGENYKWYNIADNYEDDNTAVEFTLMIDTLEDVEVAKINRELLNKTTLPDGEKDKYYVDNKGTVYYEGFEYQGNTIYNKNTQTVGTALPRVTITANTGELTNAESITYTITFNKNVNGFTKGDITVNGETNIIDISGNGTVYTLVIPTEEQEYTQIVSVGANVCQDASGNSNISGSKTITIDRAKPVVTNETSTTTDKIIIKATDGIGIIGYAVTNTNTQPTEFTSCTSTTTLTQEVTGKTPSTTYYVWVKDISGNISDRKQVTTENMATTGNVVTREDIVEHPEFYYGAKVNYMNGEQPFRNLDDNADLKWRIFYADENNIYITTTDHVGKRRLDTYYEVSNRNDAISRLRTNDGKYVNNTYVDSSKTSDAITYKIFRDSYNAIVGEDAQNLAGTEAGGYTYTNNSVLVLSGLQANLYVLSSHYWLASYPYNNANGVLFVYFAGGKVNFYNYYSSYGIRPLVCLKSNVQLVESGVEDGYMTYDLMLQQ